MMQGQTADAADTTGDAAIRIETRSSSTSTGA